MEEETFTLFAVEQGTSPSRKFSMRRSHLEIKMDILSCVKTGFEKPTQIMYKANLSWTALKDHLSSLEKGGLLSVVEYGNRRRYELTEKAMTLLMAYNNILDQVNAPVERAVSTF